VLVASSFVACTGDTSVGCSPSLTCEYQPAAFDAPPQVDAGPTMCNLQECAAAAITAGGAHTCATLSDGRAFCWGSNGRGQLGFAWPDDLSGFSPITGVFAAAMPWTATMMAAGGTHTCGLIPPLRWEGRLYPARADCRGNDDDGQVDGEPSTTTPILSSPATLGEFGAVLGLAAGDAHSCVITTGQVVCWGSNEYGQRDPRPDAPTSGASAIDGTAGVAEVAAGARHTCARFDDGHIACWGTLLDTAGHWTRVTAPVRVPGINDATELVAGGGQTCALLADRSVVCWGANDSGQLGDGTTTSSATPVTVRGISLALDVATGGAITDDGRYVGHTCIVDKDFYVLCFGENARGELGTGAGPDRATPARVLAALRDGPPDPADPTDLVGIVTIAAGAHHSCAIDERGWVFCWGDDSAGQLDAIVTPTPVDFGRAVAVPGFSRRRGMGMGPGPGPGP
jgi:alpha-tubulin suppressor-like RCC1 family protein